MRTEIDRSKPTPPRLQVQFRNWAEWDLYAEFAEDSGGKLGPLARAILLKAARAAKEQVST